MKDLNNPILGSTNEQEKGWILIAEDNSTQKDIMLFCLKKAGWKVTCCDTGTLTMGVLENNPERYDVLIFDHKLPDCTSLDIYKWMKDRNIVLPVVIVTNYISLELCTIAKKQGVECVMSKPIEISVFPTIIEDVARNFWSKRQ